MNIQVDPTSSNLASDMFNSKIRPRAVVGYGVKIFHASPPNYVTRSSGLGLRVNLFTNRVIFTTSLENSLTREQSNGQSKKSYGNRCFTFSADPPSYDKRKKFFK